MGWFSLDRCWPVSWADRADRVYGFDGGYWSNGPNRSYWPDRPNRQYRAYWSYRTYRLHRGYRPNRCYRPNR